jgi:hypothetical protein
MLVVQDRRNEHVLLALIRPEGTKSHALAPSTHWQEGEGVHPAPVTFFGQKMKCRTVMPDVVGLLRLPDRGKAPPPMSMIDDAAVAPPLSINSSEGVGFPETK